LNDATQAERLREHPDAFKDTLKGEIEEGLRLTGTDVARAETAHGELWRRFQC
jgi:amidase